MAEVLFPDSFLAGSILGPAQNIKLESLAAGNKHQRQRGFNKLNVVLLEAKHLPRRTTLGSGVLCPFVQHWPDFGEEVDACPGGYEYQFVLTAAHCVSLIHRGHVKMADAIRVRIPKYEQWTSKELRTFKPGPREACRSRRFHDVVFETREEITRFVHVYDSYKNDLSSIQGSDFCIIEIPPIKCYPPMNAFQVWIVGFPADQSRCYLPYFDRRPGQFRAFVPSSRDPEHMQMYYENSTSGGQSGGPIQFISIANNYRVVVGVHVTGGNGEASGCMITEKVRNWIFTIQQSVPRTAGDISELEAQRCVEIMERQAERIKIVAAAQE
eukprot:UN23101